MLHADLIKLYPSFKFGDDYTTMGSCTTDLSIMIALGERPPDIGWSFGGYTMVCSELNFEVYIVSVGLKVGLKRHRISKHVVIVIIKGWS